MQETPSKIISRSKSSECSEEGLVGIAGHDAGISVLEDGNDAEFGTSPAPLRCDHAIFYAGWYSLEHYHDAFTWEPGAIGLHLDSESAAKNPRRGRNWSANALLHRITVTSGSVDEPYLAGLPRVDGIVHDLLEGANVGDAFLRNIWMFDWMIINIGDPLYRPPLITKPHSTRSAPMRPGA